MATPDNREDAALRLMAAGGRFAESLLQNNGITYATKRCATELKTVAAAWEIEVNWVLPKIGPGVRAELFDAAGGLSQNICEILTQTVRSQNFDYTSEALAGSRRRVEGTLKTALTNLAVICTRLKITAVFEQVGQMQLLF